MPDKKIKPKAAESSTSKKASGDKAATRVTKKAARHVSAKVSRKAAR